MFTEILRRHPTAYDAARRIFWSRPRLYAHCGLLRNHRSIKNTNYDLCLEGFPRSANTYLKMVLDELTASQLRVQSHFHCPPAVYLAINAGKPVCLTIRTPGDAIVSRSIYNGDSVEDGLYRYISFHELLLPLLSHQRLLVATFDAITTRLPDVIAGLQNSLGLPLPSGVSCDQLHERANARIEQQSLDRYGRIEEKIVHRPSAFRRALVPQWSRKLDEPRLESLRSRATALYKLFAARSC